MDRLYLADGDNSTCFNLGRFTNDVPGSQLLYEVLRELNDGPHIRRHPQAGWMLEERRESNGTVDEVIL